MFTWLGNKYYTSRAHTAVTMAASEEVAENSQINGKKPRNTFLDNFGKLTSNEQKIRLKSGSQIIRHLSKNSENVRVARAFFDITLTNRFQEKRSFIFRTKSYNMQLDV